MKLLSGLAETRPLWVAIAARDEMCTVGLEGAKFGHSRWSDIDRRDSDHGRLKSHGQTSRPPITPTSRVATITIAQLSLSFIRGLPELVGSLAPCSP